MRSQGTSFNAKIFNKTISNLNFTMFNVSESHGIMRGNSDTSLIKRKTNENDIVCGRSYCGSQEQPTWEFCFGGR